MNHLTYHSPLATPSNVQTNSFLPKKQKEDSKQNNIGKVFSGPLNLLQERIKWWNARYSEIGTQPKKKKKKKKGGGGKKKNK